MKHVEEIIHDVRRISAKLRPPTLDLGLRAALESLAEEFESRSAISTKLQFPLLDPPLDRNSCLALYRIAQEALTNIARHSEATTVKIALDYDANWLDLMIGDDGRGATEEQLTSSSSLGLVGMRERAIFLGGDLKVTSGPGSGTLVKMRIPLAPVNLYFKE
jgi:signal transduction histidine kinase